MVDACYLCRRTQVDLDRLNEEIRTRVYLSYFSNARTQVDDQRRKHSFLQRLKDEESGDPHFRINAKQVFADPEAYRKLMPWIDTLIETARSSEPRPEENRTIGELVDELLGTEHHRAEALEDGLNQLRNAFTAGDRVPLSLETVTFLFPVNWSIEGYAIRWHPAQPNDREPLHHTGGESKAMVEVPVHLCSVCRKALQRP